MIFIPPMEIATRIMTLIDNAKTNLVLVSPYISIDGWDKFKRCLQRAVDRGIIITIYARENANQNLDSIISFNVNLVLVKDLHAKIYLNESYAIASSQNLVQYSDSNSIDFGYCTETEEERSQLLNLINQYLVATKPAKLNITEKTIRTVKKETVQETECKTFKNFEIKQIFEAFQKEYKIGRLSSESQYIYCSNIFSFGDLMIREGFEIRFNYQIKDHSSIIKILENIDLNGNHYKYNKELVMNKNHPNSFIFIPQAVIDIQNLIHDYVLMTSKILDETGGNDLR
ncbi:phospholipase D-like domain-containing protein [Flavobacterium ajazii]|uniref:hypothetical protein n=1 Tax=Flavobacterium ajazii TaxID=2692318 RepID=UPI0013D247B8|nr:hypothetical protein [Flavobacterium ajazii]